MKTDTTEIFNIMDRLQNSEANKSQNAFNIEKFAEVFRANIKKDKKLSPNNFKILKTIIITKKIKDFFTFINILENKSSLTKNESIVIGRALMKTKIQNKQMIIDFFSQRDCISSVIILQCYLCTKVKVDVTGVILLLKRFLDQVNCDILRLLLVIFRNYRSCFDEELVLFCKQHKHGICDEINEGLVETH